MIEDYNEVLLVVRLANIVLKEKNKLEDGN